MKRRKNNSYLAVAALAALVTAPAAFIDQDERPLFPEKPADMELKLPREGDVAIPEVKNRLVVWIALSNPDKTYQAMTMKEAVETIGG